MPTNSQSTPPWPELETTTEDGRRQRSDRSRRRIIEALFDLIGEGDMSPSAVNVAARAEVGLRTVFRHFEDMDSIYCLLYTSPSPRDRTRSRMPSSA